MYRSNSRVISVVRKADQPFGSKELIRKVYFFFFASSNGKTNIPKTWVISKNFIHLKQVYFIRSKLEEHEF